MLTPAAVGAGIVRQRQNPDAIRHGAAVGLSISFAFFAYGHFAMTDDLMEMLPPWVPGRSTVILATGVLEVAIAAGLQLPRTRWVVGLAISCRSATTSSLQDLFFARCMPNELQKTSRVVEFRPK